MPRLSGVRSTKNLQAAPTLYAQHADAYRALGWSLIAVRGKKSPFKGTTGRHGAVTPELDARMRRSDWHDNIAIRHTLGKSATVAIDVDEGDGKQGLATLTQLSEALGAPPVTWTSTARGSDDPRRQHFYRIPAGVELETTLTPSSALGGAFLAGDIEIPSHAHRYSVVWPSIHPDTFQPYRWYGFDGEAVDGPPAVADLPFLPDAWIAALAKEAGRIQYEGGIVRPPRPYSGTVEQWIGAQNNAAVSRVVLEAIRPYREGASFRGHHAMVSLQKRLVRLGAEGHPGTPGALAFLRDVWMASEHTPGEDCREEWWVALKGAVEKYGGTEA
ncbi:bifunctional DNA primase/polymerase [Microbacterium dextranolyticum]|uniref:DNA primase/polymerase bifunctional N-terminal domain-containing protein n=1 Tax=Microbacterium dextranolyticum TaxID=36806 RepID=A0A9W6HNC3_9MICO|nr:bifunctional DNA primase/polymerase [Microbacterium dextranolyticum]MBM7463227.1 hypothetical protein [Microbacterium dextranolyticum]GLJ95668.1 hypothetical protein GCM10017591_17310 [Microbacterium dextranolyticum]